LNNIIRRRTVAVFCAMLLIWCGIIVRIFYLTTESDYVQVVSSQSRYTINIGTSRGRIYDCRLRSLAGGRIQYRAVIEPSQQTLEYLISVLSAEKLSEISTQLTGRRPFLITVDDASVAGPGVRVYKCEERYGSNSVAVHTIGYLNGAGEGVSGIEYAFNEYLTECSGRITAIHQVNSGGRSLSGYAPVVVDTTSRSLGGVVLSIDLDLQQMAEEVADECIKKGAIVIMDAKTGAIRASVSRPIFEQNDIAASLECDNGQLVNRAISAYDIGSVFKLIVGAAALESGYSEEQVYTCEGGIQIGDNIFHCNSRAGHGEIDMKDAMAQSCNIYFIKLAQEMGGKKILELAGKFGFGKSISLAENYCTRAGCLPSEETLTYPAALANFSFGQGELMASPVHVAQLVTTIANDGVMRNAFIYEYKLSPTGVAFDEYKPMVTQVINAETAQILKGFMKETVENGTGKAGRSDYVTSGAKTGTAQTGIIKNGRQVLQAWYAGFFPYEQPEYICVVLVEDGQSGGADAGPVFRMIAERIGC